MVVEVQRILNKLASEVRILRKQYNALAAARPFSEMEFAELLSELDDSVLVEKRPLKSECSYPTIIELDVLVHCSSAGLGIGYSAVSAQTPSRTDELVECPLTDGRELKVRVKPCQGEVLFHDRSNATTNSPSQVQSVRTTDVSPATFHRKPTAFSGSGPHHHHQSTSEGPCGDAFSTLVQRALDGLGVAVDALLSEMSIMSALASCDYVGPADVGLKDHAEGERVDGPFPLSRLIDVPLSARTAWLGSPHPSGCRRKFDGGVSLHRSGRFIRAV